MDKIKNADKGFTLIELLVVVLIIGIIAAVAIPQYQVVVGRSKFAQLKIDAHSIKNALNRYYLLNDSYTQNINNLDVEIRSSCEILPTSNPLIKCFKEISGSRMEFSLGYGSRNSVQACLIGTNITNIIANKICQNETGRTTPNDAYSYKSYHYR